MGQTAGLLGRRPVRQQAYTVRVVDGTPKLLELGAFCRPKYTSLGQGKVFTFTLVTRTGASMAEFIKAEFQV